MYEPPANDDPEALDRKRFLQRTTLLIGGVTAAIIAVPAATMAVAPALHTGSYYDVDLGYNVLPGEIFLGRGRAFNNALYVTFGMGDVKFAEKDQFALNFGVGDRLLITDWLAMHLDVRDHVFETDITGRTKNVHNVEATLGLTVFF